MTAWANTPKTEEPAAADDGAPADKEALAKLLWDWYGQASALHDAGKLSEAWKIYQRIWKHRKTYDVATSLGGICLEWEQYALAAHYYKIALQEMVPTQSPAFVAQVKEAYAQARARVAEVSLDIEDGTPWKAVQVTNELRGVKLEPPLFLEEGPYTLVATAEGAVPVRLRGRAAPGASIQWPIRFEKAEPPTDAPTTEFDGRTKTARHPWIVLPIGGVVTTGLAIAAWSNANTGKEAYDDVLRVNLAPQECAAEPPSNRCEEVRAARERAEDAGGRAWWFGGGAVAAAVATGLVYWLWESEVPVEASYDPVRRAGEMRWTYEF